MLRDVIDSKCKFNTCDTSERHDEDVDDEAKECLKVVTYLF